MLNFLKLSWVALLCTFLNVTTVCGQDTTFGFQGVIQQIRTLDGAKETIEKYYGNGQRESVEIWVNGLREGKYLTWHINGEKENEAFFENGLQVGKTQKWANNGQLIALNQFGIVHSRTEGTSSVLVGKYRTYFNNGQKAVKGQYVSGKKSGKWLEWNESRTLISKANYLNGAKDGVNILYYPSGKLKSKHNYEAWRDPVKGEWVARLHRAAEGYFEDGSPYYKARYQHGLRHGEIMSRWPNGQLRNVHHFENDTMVGLQKDYFEDGKLREERTTIFTTKNGERKLVWHGNYSRSNQDESERDYQHFTLGEPSGEWLSYRNGSLFSRKTHNLVDSTERTLIFNTDGDTMAIHQFEFFYKDGRREVKSFGYNMKKHQNGDLQYRQNFNGRGEGWNKEYHYGGRLKSEETFDFNRDVHHIIKQYNDREVLTNLYGYVRIKDDNGKETSKLHGPHLTYGDNGILIKKAYYNRGKLLGSVRKYFLTGNLREYYIPLSGKSDHEGSLPGIGFYFFADGSLQKIMLNQFYIEWFNNGGIKEVHEMYSHQYNTYKINWLADGSVQSNREFKVTEPRRLRAVEQAISFYFDMFNEKRPTGIETLLDPAYTGPLLLRWPDNKNLFVGSFEKGLLHNRLEVSNIHGGTFVDGTFESGLLQGPLTINNFNGLKYLEKSFENGNLNGPQIQYGAKGLKEYEDEYKNGELLSSTRFDDNGQKKSFYGPRKTSINWYPNGVLANSRLINCAEECDSFYTINLYFENEQLKASGKENLNRRRIGSWESYHENGILASKTEYEDHRMEGSYLEWDNTGKLLGKGQYRNGRREGKWQTVRKGELTDVIYRNGNLTNVLGKAQVPCQCVDTNFTAPPTASRLSTLLSQEKFEQMLFNFHSGETHWYSKLFFSGLSNQGSSYNMDILSRTELATTMRSSGGLGIKFIINTCPNFDGMSRTKAYVEDGGSKLSTFLWMETPQSGLLMKKGLLTAIDSASLVDTLVDQPYFFTTKEIEYGSKGLTVGEVPNSCLPSTLIGRSGIVTSTSGEAVVNLLSSYNVAYEVEGKSFFKSLPDIVRTHCKKKLDDPGFCNFKGELMLPLKIDDEKKFFKTEIVMVKGGFDFFSFVVVAKDPALIKDPRKVEIGLQRIGLENAKAVLSKSGEELYITGTYLH